MRQIICILLFVYWLILLVRVLMSWFPTPSSGVFRVVVSAVYDVTEPLMRPLRGMLPPVRMGMMAIDFSPILLFIVIGILQRAICG